MPEPHPSDPWPGDRAHAVDTIVDARSSTVQLANGYLYLDAAADPAHCLLGYDEPDAVAAGPQDAAALLDGLAEGFRCIAVTATLAAALAIARNAAGRDAVVIDALAGEPAVAPPRSIAIENRSIGRSGAWFASLAWRRAPDLIVVGEALAAGGDFAAVLARGDLADSRPAPGAGQVDGAVAARVAAVVAAVESRRLLADAAALGGYLQERLESLRAGDDAVSEIEVLPLGARIGFRERSAAAMTRKLCERGVLVGLDGAAGRIVVAPALVIRPAEIDVIVGVIRGALHDTPTWRPSSCCAACETIDAAG